MVWSEPYSDFIGHELHHHYTHRFRFLGKQIQVRIDETSRPRTPGSRTTQLVSELKPLFLTNLYILLFLSKGWYKWNIQVQNNAKIKKGIQVTTKTYCSSKLPKIVDFFGLVIFLSPRTRAARSVESFTEYVKNKRIKHWSGRHRSEENGAKKYLKLRSLYNG